MIVYIPKGTNNTVGLLHGMSIYDLRQKQMPPSDDLVDRDRLRIFTPEAALARLPESFNYRFPVEAATALSSIKTTHASGYHVRESDPFEGDQEFGTTTSDASGGHRCVPGSTCSPIDPDAYFRHVSDLYQNDTYHSPSIEGYHVTADLIERVRSGEWDSDGREENRWIRDALLARGYWQAFQHVRDAVGKVLSGESPESPRAKG